MSLEDIGPRPVHSRDEEEAYLRLLRTKRATFAVVVMVLIVVVVGFGLGLWLILRQSAENHEVAEQIRSCTDPAGDCYQEQQARTSDLVGIPQGPINTVTALTAYCVYTKGADTVPEILACVDDQLKTLDQNGATP